MKRLIFAYAIWMIMVTAFPSSPQAGDYIDLGIEKTDLYSGGAITTDFVTTNPIALVVTVRNYSSIAIDGFTLVPKIETYHNGSLLGPAGGAFFFQPNYINNAANTQLSKDRNGTFAFRADMTQPKAGHYRCVINFTVGGSIGNQDSNSANNQKTIEFDVRQVDPPKPDLAIENFQVTKTGDTFQIGYSVRNTGTDPAQSVFDMKAKIFVIKGPTTIMTREDVFRQHDQPLAPGASVNMGPFVIRDSRYPNAGLSDGAYKVGVYTTQGCNYDTNITNNRVETMYDFTSGSGPTVPDVIDLGIEKTDLYSGGAITTDFVTTNPIALVVTVRNYSSIAIDGFTLVPKIETYYNGALLGPAGGAFYFQPNYINNAANTQLSIDRNGTFAFRADMTQPKAGHYRCVISFTLGGSIGNQDSNSVNNQKTIEFDVRQVEPPKPDLAIENFQVTKTGDTFQIGYRVRNAGTDPAQSVFDMKAKIFVIKSPTTIMTREDVFRQHDQPLDPGASVNMGPFVIRDARYPNQGLSDGIYSVGVYTTQGCNYDTSITNNRAEASYHFWQGGGDYSIEGVPSSCRSGETLSVSYKCALAQPALKMGLFGVNESGVNPKLGWKDATGTSGTLSFKSPEQTGRYLFKLYSQTAGVKLSSPVFTVIKAVASTIGSSVEGSMISPVDANVPSSIRADALDKGGAWNPNDRSPDANCAQNLPLKVMNGYSVAECAKDYGESVILLDESPASQRNMRIKGMRSLVRYVWEGDAGACPADAQIKRSYISAARKIGAKILVDRPRYTAFELTVSGKKSYASVETLNGGRSIVFISIEPEAGTTAPRVSPLERFPNKASEIRKRSSSSADAAGKDDPNRSPDKDCSKNLMFSGIDGYTVTRCAKHHDGALILFDENPDSKGNRKIEGETTSVHYAWPEDAGEPPGDARIRRIYKNEAKTMGAKILADRPGYTAFGLTVSGQKTYAVIETSQGGQSITVTSVRPGTME
jgi:hypothetical protein